MQNPSFLALTALVFAGSPLAAQNLVPSARDVPSETAIASCTAKISVRWALMTPTQQRRQTQSAMITTCAINTDIASYAIAQGQAITDQQNQHTAALAARQIALAKNQSDWEAAVQQQKNEYAAVYVQWEADADACKAGDTSKCAPQ